MKRMLTVLAAVMAAVVSQTVMADGVAKRTVSIVSSDPETGTINLAFGGDAEGRALFVAQDDEDRGTVPSAWRETRLVT